MVGDGDRRREKRVSEGGDGKKEPVKARRDRVGRTGIGGDVKVGVGVMRSIDEVEPSFESFPDVSEGSRRETGVGTSGVSEAFDEV